MGKFDISSLVKLLYLIEAWVATLKTQKNCITFIQRRPNVFDAGPTLYKCYTNVLCLLGSHLF